CPDDDAIAASDAMIAKPSGGAAHLAMEPFVRPPPQRKRAMQAHRRPTRQRRQTIDDLLQRARSRIAHGRPAAAIAARGAGPAPSHPPVPPVMADRNASIRTQVASASRQRIGSSRQEGILRAFAASLPATHCQRPQSARLCARAMATPHRSRIDARSRPSRHLRPPAARDCIVVPEEAGGLSADAIFALMSQAADWRPVPDPRTPMAFARAPGWVFKSNLAWRRQHREWVWHMVKRMASITALVGVWHPAKTWFLLCDRRRYLVCNATPVLLLPSEAGLLRRLLHWPQQRRLVAKAAEHGFRLDHRVRNFGFDPGGWQLYYVDDEVYPLRPKP